MEFSSKFLEHAVNQVAQLPGIGKKSALRMVLHLLKQPKEHVYLLAESLVSLANNIQHCSNCHNISDRPVCEICNNVNRDHQTICVVEDIRDVMAIENTGQYNGVYHILGGKISPMDGIGPSQLNINSLVDRVQKQAVVEIIFALNATMEAETTNFYIFKKLEQFKLKFSSIARGISVGNELEYTDEITLGRSILHRVPFDQLIDKGSR